MNDLLIWNNTPFSLDTREVKRLQQKGVDVTTTDDSIQIHVSAIGVYKEKSNKMYLSIRAPYSQEIIRLNLDEENMVKLHECLTRMLIMKENMVFTPK